MLRLTMPLALMVAVLSAPAIAAQHSSAQQTRDWSAIDTNHDHYISPTEMEAYLQHVWAQQSKKG